MKDWVWEQWAILFIRIIQVSGLVFLAIEMFK